MPATVAPPCPRCKATTAPLARDGDIQRFECAPCSYSFTAPAIEPPAELAPPLPEAPRVAHSTILPPDPHDVPPVPIGTSRRSSVSPTGESVKAYCPKCWKPYFRTGQRFDAHIITCTGTKTGPTPTIPSAPDAPQQLELPSPPPAPERPPAAAPNGAVARAVALSIEALRARRAGLTAEILQIDSAITTLEKLQGGEALDGPFPEGVPAAP